MPPIPQRATPNMGDPGDIFTVRIYGDVLSRTTRVSFGPGIQTSPPTVINDGEVRVKIHIADGAAPGPRDIIVTDPRGDGSLPNGFMIL